MLVKHPFEYIWYTFLEFTNKKGVCMYFYQRLRDLREDAELKQENVSRFLEITRQQYQLYESGKREIPFHLVIKLAEFYNVTIDYIAGLTNEKRSLSEK